MLWLAIYIAQAYFEETWIEEVRMCTHNAMETTIVMDAVHAVPLVLGKKQHASLVM